MQRLSTFAKQHIHDTLWDLLDHPRSRDPINGICYTLKDPLQWGSNSDTRFEINKWLIEQFEKWPQFSGDVNFPVPAPKSWKHPLLNPYYTLPLWTGKYGESRIQLVMFLLQQLDQY